MPSSEIRQPRVGRTRPYIWVSVTYLALGCLWIVSSDHVAGAIAPGEEALKQIQTWKGWFFVLVSSVLIFVLTRGAFLRLEKAELAKREIFKSTLGASDHIILNYLNQMQLVMMEAERCVDFDESIYKLAQKISDQTVDELKQLESLNASSSDDIEAYLNLRIREAYEVVSGVHAET